LNKPERTTLDDLIASDARYYQASVARLGETAGIVDDINSAYDRLIDLIGQSTTADPAPLATYFHLLMAGRYDFNMAAASALRGQLTLSLQILRRGIDTAATAWLIYRKPALVGVWNKAASDREAFAQWKTAARTPDLFPKDDTVVWPLYERYEFCSRMVHASLVSVGRRHTIARKDGQVQMRAYYGEITDEDKTEPVRSLLYLVQTYTMILSVFTQIYEQHIGENRPSWDVRLNAIRARGLFEFERWHLRPAD